METSKIKTYVIVVLLLLNACLAALVVAKHADGRAAGRGALQSIHEILAARQIAVTGDADLSAKGLAAVTAVRDTAQEQALAERLLGAAVSADQGNGRIMYTGKSGQAVFRGTGEFELLMTDGSVLLGKSPARTGVRLMEKLGMSSRAADAVVAGDGKNCTVVMTACLDSHPILNSRVTFTFTGGKLLLAVGRRTPELLPSSGGADSLDAATALMRFLELLRTEGRACAELSALEPCYLLETTDAGEGRLLPVWRVSTDTGEDLISAVTGEPVAAPSR